MTADYFFNRFVFFFLGKAFKFPFNQALESELTPKRNFAEGEFQIVGKKTLKVFLHPPPPWKENILLAMLNQ